MCCDHIGGRILLSAVNAHFHPGARTEPGLVDAIQALGGKAFKALRLHRVNQIRETRIERRGIANSGKGSEGQGVYERIGLDSGVRSRVDTFEMSACCGSPDPVVAAVAPRCPQSGTKGLAVDLLTVKALLCEQPTSGLF